MYNKILRDNINHILTVRGITKSNLSFRSGVSVSFLSDLTNGKANPSLSVIAKIAHGLEVPLPALLSSPLPTTGPIAPGQVLKTAVLSSYQAYQLDQWTIANLP